MKSRIEKNETCVDSINEFMDFASNYSKAIFYSDPGVEFDHMVTNRMAKMIWMKQSLQSLNKNYSVNHKFPKNSKNVSFLDSFENF